MIKVHLFNWDCGTLDIEKELGISGDTIDFLEQNISGLNLMDFKIGSHFELPQLQLPSSDTVPHIGHL